MCIEEGVVGGFEAALVPPPEGNQHHGNHQHERTAEDYAPVAEPGLAVTTGLPAGSRLGPLPLASPAAIRYVVPCRLRVGGRTRAVEPHCAAGRIGGGFHRWSRVLRRFASERSCRRAGSRQRSTIQPLRRAASRNAFTSAASAGSPVPATRATMSARVRVPSQRARMAAAVALSRTLPARVTRTGPPPAAGVRSRCAGVSLTFGRVELFALMLSPARTRAGLCRGASGGPTHVRQASSAPQARLTGAIP